MSRSADDHQRIIDHLFIVEYSIRRESDSRRPKSKPDQVDHEQIDSRPLSSWG